MSKFHACAESLHGQNPFAGSIFRHHQFNFDTENTGDHRQGNSCIAAGGFNQPYAGLKVSPVAGTLDHPVSSPVFYAASRIIPFQFGVNFNTGVWINIFKVYQWRIPRSEEHTSELQSLMRISYAVFFLK